MLRQLFAAVALATSAVAQLTAVTGFGDNPTKLTMAVHVPSKLGAKPPIILVLHGCLASGAQFYGQTKMGTFADQNGVILIVPTTTNMNSCWDVQNPATLTHGSKGGDATGLISMINYTIQKYSADPERVFVMGSSSGAMMTNVMAATYPDVFAGGAAYSGVAHACFAGAASATPMSPNQTCAQGLTHTPEDWAKFVYNSYPGYTGKRPKMQIWHGLADGLVKPACAQEALKQWSQVLGVQLTKNNSATPSSAYTQMMYGDGTKLQGYFGVGVGHTAPVNEQYMFNFFGLLAKS